MIGYHDLDGLGILDELQSLCAAAAGQHLVVDSDRPRENVQQERVVVYAKHAGSAVGCNSHDTLSRKSSPRGARRSAPTDADALRGHRIRSLQAVFRLSGFIGFSSTLFGLR